MPYRNVLSAALIIVSVVTVSTESFARPIHRHYHPVARGVAVGAAVGTAVAVGVAIAAPRVVVAPAPVVVTPVVVAPVCQYVIDAYGRRIRVCH